MPKYFTPTRLSEKMCETPEGFLLCLGVPITRTGELVYGEGETPLETDDDGQVVITREESDVFNEYTIASFEGKPVTINHPTEFVNPSNWHYLAKGHMQNVRRGSGEMADYLLTDLLIKDATAIALIKNGLREVSGGYEAEYIQIEEGKGRQRRIVGNHLALVEKGRAGSTCAITDHKGKELSSMGKKIAERMKSIFAKAVDEAVKDEEMEGKKEDKKSEDQKASGMDELVKMVKDLNEKVDSMTKGKDESSEEKKSEEKKDDSKDESGEEKKEEKKDDSKDESGEKSMEERLSQLETAVQKLLEKLADKSEDSDEDKKEEKSEDADEDESDESEDDDFEESSLTGDTAARAEILSPGIEKSKDMKTQALKNAYATKEGKEVINALTGGKAPAFDSAEKVDTLFIAASEVLKSKRSHELSETKKSKSLDSASEGHTDMTAERLNEINKAHYGLSK